MRITLITVLLAFSFSIFGQSKIGFRAGFNMSNIRLDFMGSDELEFNFKPGFHFGVVSATEISKKLYLNTALMFNSKGTMEGNLDGDDYNRSSFNYLEVPVNLMFQFDNHFNISLGGYFAVGVGGVNKIQVSGNRAKRDLVPTASEISFQELGNDELPYNRLDYGLDFNFGYMIQQTLISLGYSHGLNNISVGISDVPGVGTIEADDGKAFHQVISLSCTYFLN